LIYPLWLFTFFELATQQQVLPASTGFGGKMPKGKSAFGAASPQLWAMPTIARRKRCWAVFMFQISDSSYLVDMVQSVDQSFPIRRL